MVLVSLIVFLQIFLNYDYHFVESANFQKCFPCCDSINCTNGTPQSTPGSFKPTPPPGSRFTRISPHSTKPSQPKPSITATPPNLTPSEEKLLKHLQPNDIGRNPKFDDLNHDSPTLCTRNCTKHADPRICYYIFTIEIYHAMGIACQDCPNKTEDCFAKHCIPVNGIERQVHSINRMIPGPAIDVCRGDRIIVDVINKMTAEDVTIHWHGVYQKGTPWMDGVPFVTQCPIPSNSKFRYDFRAFPSGTLFYHSHTGTSHANGVYGSLTVRVPEAEDPNADFHHYDLPSNNILIADWNHSPFNIYFPGYYKDKSHIPIRPEAYLINGRGRNNTNTPFAEFHVERGEKHRFRIIGATTSTCPFKFAIQHHSMKVVALDGFPCLPFDVDALVMVGGQRTDVVIEANRGINSAHWILVNGMGKSCQNITQAALLVYDGAEIPTGPLNPPTFDEMNPKPVYLNNHDIPCSHRDNVCSDSIRLPPLYKAPPAIKRLINETANITIELRGGNHPLPLEQLIEEYEHFHMPMGKLPTGESAFASTLNNVSGIFPPVPLLTQRSDIPQDFSICSPGCENMTLFRRCLCLVPVPLHSVVDIVFNRAGTGAFHPIHIHGHHFTVIPVRKQGTAMFEKRTGNARGVEEGLIQRDTVFVPLDGKTTIRFRADNPGYWLMHCHYHMHMEGGMFLVFQVGTEKEIPQPPNGFPKCGHYLPPIKDL